MRWFKNAKMSVKLLTSFVAVAGLTAIMGTIVVRGILSADDRDTMLYEQATRPLGAVADLARDYQRVRGNRRDVIMMEGQFDKYNGKLGGATKDVQTDLARLDSSAVTKEAKDGIAGVRAELATLAPIMAGIDHLAETRQYGEAKRQYAADASYNQVKKVELAIDSLSAYYVRHGDGISTANTKTADRLVATAVSLVVVVVVLAILLGLLIARIVSRPLREAVSLLQRLANGDLTVRMTVDSKDEFGEMATAFNSSVTEMHRSVSAIAESAQTLAAASEELSAVSTQMGANAEETSAQAGVVSAAAEQVSKNIQTVAAGAEQMGASIKEISSNSTRAAQVAQTAVKTADATNATVTQLGVSSAEIGNVIKVITSIAEQTNLLALNATIEAARAGEAGKGFAVVANEVKELAKETARATDDIARKVEAIQSDTKGAVTAIGEIATVIRQINDISGTIASAVEEQSATTSEIGRNVEEAAKGAGEIANNITGVATAAQSTSTGVQNAKGAATELSQMAATLTDLVGRFTLGAAGSSAAAPRPSVIGRPALRKVA